MEKLFSVEVTSYPHKSYAGLHEEYFNEVKTSCTYYYSTKEEALSAFLRARFGDFYDRLWMEDGSLKVSQYDEGGQYLITIKWDGIADDVKLEYKACTDKDEELGTYETFEEASAKLYGYYDVPEGELELTIYSDRSTNGHLHIDAQNYWGYIVVSLVISKELDEKVNKLSRIPCSYSDYLKRSRSEK